MKTVLQHLFSKDTLDEIPLETINRFAGEYPYFAMGQFLLTKKMQQLDDVQHARQFQKTLVYFHNPLWLEYQLNRREAANGKRQTVNEDLTYAGAEVPGMEIPDASNDLIEDVVLHQEKVPDTPEEKLYSKDVEIDKPVTGPDREMPLGTRFNISREELKTPADENEEESPGPPLNFQSLHTVDYFASQGIKITNEFTPEDKLGKQLKSFTEWLKTMRRLPEASVQEVLETSHDREVERYASSSLEEKEVLTEAMAEVLIKQGKQEKAADVYRKLSLLNPQKSAYFAAKLEGLKLN